MHSRDTKSTKKLKPSPGPHCVVGAAQRPDDIFEYHTKTDRLYFFLCDSSPLPELGSSSSGPKNAIPEFGPRVAPDPYASLTFASPVTSYKWSVKRGAKLFHN